MTDTTINDAEVEKFVRMADEWWDPNGKLKPLHKINPQRLQYIRDHAISHFGRDSGVRRPLEGLRILDIGCGGGLLSEPMARLGATVVGIDPAEENIRIASVHAEAGGVAVDYRAATSEQLAAAGEKFDIVLAMEVIEHVDNVPLFVKSCTDLVKPGGLLVMATINRTPRAYALAIVGAEYVLRWLPRGTHDFSKFLTPDEVSALIGRNGMRVTDRTGVVYNPLRDEWRHSPDMGVNYMMLAEKPAA
ncbi:MAG TPA: bifunctional 2-polyprenyl-6-hydroxyphenol methylase/3-demethylubiquinol 3-O-methyltransferase UbiG [Devosia sp.]|nr:bifunctional 2-polyprenyl-6-hydroxyphenol methylase/3-demethylubiquinol 3-O-methyltransferase UbiG [Devosia sp.]